MGLRLGLLVNFASAPKAQIERLILRPPTAFVRAVREVRGQMPPGRGLRGGRRIMVRSGRTFVGHPATA
jgi:hypothetical protein